MALTEFGWEFVKSFTNNTKLRLDFPLGFRCQRSCLRKEREQIGIALFGYGKAPLGMFTFSHAVPSFGNSGKRQN